jgi:uncharacterized damage-inducible protein DinB
MNITKDTLDQQFGYSSWATALVLDACGALSAVELYRDLKSSHGGVLGTLHHLFFADRLWLARLEGHQRPLHDPNESPSLDELCSAWPVLFEHYRAWLANTSEAALHEPFSYLNLKGEPYSVIRWQALLHVVNHGSIHRGQVVSMLRQLGHKPPVTDLLYYYLQPPANI